VARLDVLLRTDQDIFWVFWTSMGAGVWAFCTDLGIYTTQERFKLVLEQNSFAQYF
jgi:hypothetical protein